MALAYAERHPYRVTEIILWGVTTGRRKEFDWLFRGGVAVLFPEQWERLRNSLPAAERESDIVHHNAWLDDGVLLRNACTLANIPGVMVNGRYDLQAPIGWAYDLKRAWPRAELVIVDNAGHDSSNALVTEQLIRATNHFA